MNKLRDILKRYGKWTQEFPLKNLVAMLTWIRLLINSYSVPFVLILALKSEHHKGPDLLSASMIHAYFSWKPALNSFRQKCLSLSLSLSGSGSKLLFRVVLIRGIRSPRKNTFMTHKRNIQVIPWGLLQIVISHKLFLYILQKKVFPVK